MLGGETGKITFGRIRNKLGRGVKEFRFVYDILVQRTGADSRLSLLSYDCIYHAEGSSLHLARVTAISLL